LGKTLAGLIAAMAKAAELGPGRLGGSSCPNGFGAAVEGWQREQNWLKSWELES